MLPYEKKVAAYWAMTRKGSGSLGWEFAWLEIQPPGVVVQVCQTAADSYHADGAWMTTVHPCFTWSDKMAQSLSMWKNALVCEDHSFWNL